MIRSVLIVLASFLIGAPTLAQVPCGDRRIALSFDDSPWRDTAVMSGWERTGRIIAALTGAKVEEAAFFSVSERLDGDGEERLRAYAKAGHIIASHSHTHANLHRVGAQAFLEDVQRADQSLAQLPGFQRWFRFPYLNEGQTGEERDAVRAGLQRLGYQQGYVTVDTFDFYLDAFLRNASTAGREFDRSALRDLYVESILGAASHYDGLACRWIGRSPAHVLLLHENDVAALFLGNLIDALRQDGWTIIPVSEAYEDPIAANAPDTLLLGQGRVAALAQIEGADAASLRSRYENSSYLDQRLAQIPAAPAPSTPSENANLREIEAILAQSRRFSAAYVAGDIETLVSIYAEDGVAGAGGRDFVRGRIALRRFWQPAEGIDIVRHRAVPDQIVVHDRIAYDWGHYVGSTRSETITRPFCGKYLIVWRLEDDGIWRMVQDMWSGTGEPAPGSDSPCRRLLQQEETQAQ